MWAGVGQGRLAYLTGYHEHGEDEDEAGFGHREPAGLLEGEEYGSVEAGFRGAGGGSLCYYEAPRSPGLFPSGPDPLLHLPTTSPSFIPASPEWEVGSCRHGIDKGGGGLPAQ